METTHIIEIENQYTSGVYSKRNAVIVKGKGATLWDNDGNSYIDCVGGHGTANIGHAVPEVIQAIQEQAQKIMVSPEIFYNDQRAALSEKLCQLTDMGKVFLCNSGTEAVEAAFKFARLITGKSEIIATMRGFHGRTFGALSATWEKTYRTPFEPLVPGFKHIPYNKLSALEESINENTAAVILEVVQGEGGVNPAAPEFLIGAQDICRKNGILLIIDEVQTGFGRTGKMFAFQHYNLQPDILCLAKSIAGGLPMGATLLGKHISPLPTKVHGSTFGGNPVVCAAALATIDYILHNNLCEKSAELGKWFIDELRTIDSPLIREVRGMGLMVGIELKGKSTPYLQALMEHGVMALPAGMTVMRFLPPLVIGQEELSKVVSAVRDVLNQDIKIAGE